MGKKIPRKSLETISATLLVLCAVFFAISLALIAHHFYQRNETELLQAELLGRAELQTQLLRSQSSDHSVYPHLDQNIGYVLNPYMSKSTWHGPDQGEAYHINSIGLRGDEIAKKKAGVKRILLVGDSVIFGWRLRDEDRISSVMTTYLADRLPADRIEVITVALPGWNVISEKAFLENHLDLLQPDIIIWKLLRNDLEDVAGVVPPGRLAGWNSPQKSAQDPVRIGSNFQKNLAMPFIMERWNANVAAIQSMAIKYDIPLLLIGLNPKEMPLFQKLVDRNQLRLPTVIYPGQFFYNKESWCISKTDCHPTPWATNIIALGLLDKLVRLGWIPEIEFEASEQQITQAFQAEERLRTSAEESLEFFRDQLVKVPNQFVAGTPQSRQSILYGLDVKSGDISKNGVIFLRDVDDSSFLELELEAPDNPRAYPRSAVFTVRNEDAERTQLDVDIVKQHTPVRIPLPPHSAGSVYELLWEFDYSNCRRPDFCTSGTLHSARFDR